MEWDEKENDFKILWKNIKSQDCRQQGWKDQYAIKDIGLDREEVNRWIQLDKVKATLSSCGDLFCFRKYVELQNVAL